MAHTVAGSITTSGGRFGSGARSPVGELEALGMHEIRQHARNMKGILTIDPPVGLVVWVAGAGPHEFQVCVASL